MLKTTLILMTLVSAIGTGFPSAALASRAIAGRIHGLLCDVVVGDRQGSADGDDR